MRRREVKRRAVRWLEGFTPGPVGMCMVTPPDLHDENISLVSGQERMAAGPGRGTGRPVRGQPPICHPEQISGGWDRDISDGIEKN